MNLQNQPVGIRKARWIGLFIILVAIIGGGTYFFMSRVRVAPPQMVFPSGAPASEYTSVSPDGDDGWRESLLADVVIENPEDLKEIQIFVPRETELESTQMLGTSFTILSNVRYIFNDGTYVSIEVSEPSQMARESGFFLGNRQIELLNDREVWLSESVSQSSAKNEIAFEIDEMIIRVASNLPVEDLLEVASSLIFNI